MGRDTEIKIKYGIGGLPTQIDELLDKADETDLKILVALYMLADKDGRVSRSSLDELNGIEKDDIGGAIKFWKGAGVIESKGTSKKKNDKVEVEPKKERIAIGAHRNGAIEKSAELESYSSGELADLLEKRVVSAQFLDEAQRIVGKIFRTYDTGILVSIVERLGFEEDAVLVILNYMVGKGKKTMRYAETVAMALYDEGITDTAGVIERIQKIEQAGEVIEKIKKLYGINDRALSATEKRLFTTWTEKYAYDIEVIKMAYDITVDNTQKPIPRYTGSILDRWYEEGLREADDVKRYLERQSSEKDGGNVAKSYNADDFFEAALQRSYEDMK